MRIVHVFNMANDAYMITKGLRKLGIDADLIVQKPAHVASLPQWEDAEIDLTRIGDPWQPNWETLDENWNIPHWVHTWDASGSRHTGSRALKWIQLLGMLKCYDLIVGHVPFAKCAVFCRRPYVIYDAGWIRYLHRSIVQYRLARWGYRFARKILFTNVDTYDIFVRQGFDPKRLEFSPFVIDTDRYRPGPSRLSVKNDCDLLIFSPTRHEWSEKGNDRLIKAFGNLVKRKPRSKLVLVEWGNDLSASKSLVLDLGIQRKVSWVPIMHKKRLIEWYRLADVVADQFILGAYGTTAPEAMSCEKPVVMYSEDRHFKRWHGDVPPVVNARSTAEILEMLQRLEDPALRSQIGRRSREWVIKQHSVERAAERHLKICRDVLERTSR